MGNSVGLPFLSEDILNAKNYNNPGQYQKVLLIIKKICEFKPKNNKEKAEQLDRLIKLLKLELLLDSGAELKLDNVVRITSKNSIIIEFIRQLDSILVKTKSVNRVYKATLINIVNKINFNQLTDVKSSLFEFIIFELERDYEIDLSKYYNLSDDEITDEEIKSLNPNKYLIDLINSINFDDGNKKLRVNFITYLLENIHYKGLLNEDMIDYMLMNTIINNYNFICKYLNEELNKLLNSV